ncbi:MAG TPA: acetyl-CoA carboxylase biotin carboxyl carrier protein [Longimicrobiales bacterium]|nr:acetyl-CoA carboxylase biotin carboxyl carrier protein [Longimicrobiales bacterium]
MKVMDEVPAETAGQNGGTGRAMMDLEFVRGLIEAVDESGIDSLEITRAGTRIRIAKTPPPAPVSAVPMAPPSGPVMAGAAPANVQVPNAAGDAAAESAAAATTAEAPASNLAEVTSPMVGTFYRAPAPEAPAYVEVGSRVAKGQTLCILEAMKLMNELESELDGEVREILVENGEPVEYGQTLFLIDPA